MAQFFEIHPTHPQQRLIERAVDLLRSGGVIVYPTDSSYALGCKVGEKEAMERIRQIRQLSDNHLLTLMCRDLSELSQYTRIDNSTFRFLKSHTPGAYTFILPASKEVPRRLQHPKRKTIGIRICNHPIVMHLLESLNEPLMSITLKLPNDSFPMVDPYEMRERLEKQVDAVIDGGHGSIEQTTLIDLTSGTPELIRQGKGEFS